MIGTGRRHKDCGKRPQKQTKKTDRGEEEQDGWQQKGDWHSRSEDWQRRLTEFCPLFISFQRFRGVFSCLVLLLEIIIIALCKLLTSFTSDQISLPLHQTIIFFFVQWTNRMENDAENWFLGLHLEKEMTSLVFYLTFSHTFIVLSNASSCMLLSLSLLHE